MHFRHASRDIDAIVHGDDFVSTTDSDDLLWLSSILESKFELTTTIVGHDKYDVKHVKVLNRVIEVAS